MKLHANSHDNQAEHHLYEIYDTIDEEVYKYGVSGEPLLDDGSSPRANRQVREYNRIVGLLRFLAKVLLTGISGRKKAEEIENEKVEEHERLYDKRPRGNPKRGK